MKPGLLLIGAATPRMMDKFNALFDVFVCSEIEGFDDWLDANGARVHAIATNGHDGVRSTIMKRCPNLKIISCYGVGYDNIDANAAAAAGVVVTHTPNVLNAEVANTAIMLMLAVSRRIIVDDQWVRSGNWAAKGNAPLRDSMERSKVGILGLGRIGEAIAQKLQAFSCEVSYHARSRRDHVDYQYFGDLVAMAEAVDYLIVITPGGAATNKLVSKEVLEALGPQGVLINVARGTVVDEAALVDALQSGMLGGAGLDVFENEPQVPEALFPLENVVLLPHVGSATVQTRQAMGDLTVENLERYFTDGTVSTPVPECSEVAISSG